MAKVLLRSKASGLRWGLADVVVDPWRPGSQSGHVHGGIRNFSAIPPYFRERRVQRGVELVMNRDLPPADLRSPVREYCDLAYYLGPLHRHFGHAVVESAPRLWFYQRASFLAAGRPLPLVILPPADTARHLRRYEVGDLEFWQKSLLDLYGVSLRDLRFVRDVVRFRRLIVPEPAWLWGGRALPKHAAVLRRAATWPPLRRAGGGVRLYLVRGEEYFCQGAVAGERVVREFFRANGYRIVDPLALSLRDQVEVVSEAGHVFGVQGSAFHLLNLAGNDEVRVGCLGRMGVQVTRSFVNSIEPFVGDLRLLRPDGAECCSESSRGGTTGRLALHRDVPRLLEFMKAFDPLLDVEHFDGQAFLREVEADRRRFGRCRGHV